MKRCASLMLTACLAVGILTGCGNKSIEKGTEYLEDERYEKAVETFKDAIEDGEDKGEAYRGIGIAQWELGQYEASRNAFQSALDNGADKTATIYNFLGNCALQMGDAKDALDYYSLGLASEDCKDELKKEMRYNEIAAYEQNGEWKNAKTKLKDYITDYPDDEKAAKEAEFLETQTAGTAKK